MIGTTVPGHLAQVDHGGALPELGATRVNLYLADKGSDPVQVQLAALLRGAYGGLRVGPPRRGAADGASAA